MYELYEQKLLVLTVVSLTHQHIDESVEWWTFEPKPYSMKSAFETGSLTLNPPMVYILQDYLCTVFIAINSLIYHRFPER